MAAVETAVESIMVVVVVEFELKDSLPFENKGKEAILIANTTSSLPNKDTGSVY